MRNSIQDFFRGIVEKQLKYRYWVLLVMLLLTLFFGYNVVFKLRVVTDFFELYPRNMNISSFTKNSAKCSDLPMC